jgi:hypothetical protein
MVSDEEPVVWKALLGVPNGAPMGIDSAGSNLTLRLPVTPWEGAEIISSVAAKFDN